VGALFEPPPPLKFDALPARQRLAAPGSGNLRCRRRDCLEIMLYKGFTATFENHLQCEDAS
jgi:hypothetical protein